MTDDFPIPPPGRTYHDTPAVDDGTPGCPACETGPGYPPYTLAPGQRWCPNDDCRVKTFLTTTPANKRTHIHD